MVNNVKQVAARVIPYAIESLRYVMGGGGCHPWSIT